MMNYKKESENKKARVVWSMQLHQKFVDAVNQLGIDEAVPRKILELMNDKNLTRQHVASHLQKYKLHLKRSSNSMANQQHDYCFGQSPCVPAVQKLPSSGTIHFAQNHNTNTNGCQNGVESTSMLEWFCNQTFDSLNDSQATNYVPSEWWDILNEDDAIYYSNVASSSCSKCSQVSDEIAKFRQEIAATRDENRHVREIIQAMKTQQEMLVQAVLQIVPQ